MASVSDEVQDDRNPLSWVLVRPREVLMSLPVEYRWEFTRRHPYYLQFWQLALRRHEHRSDDELERFAEDAARIILGGIGIAESTRPPDPRQGFDALDMHDLGGLWLGGAVAPAMLRTLAQILLLALPASQRAQLGRLLNESAEYGSSDSPQMRGIYSRLAELTDPAWDSFPEVPFLSVNLQMPLRAISEAMEELVRRWKEERGIPEHRRRDDKLVEYLRAWDLREGWSDGSYQSAAEKTFREISQDTRTPIQTVIDRYRTAFRYLSGHEYTPELWIRLVGPLKLSRHFANPEAMRLLLRRPWRSPNLRPVTESVLLPGRKEYENRAFLEGAGVSQSDIAVVDLSVDIDTLLDRGRSNSEIIEELELQSLAAVDLLSELRRRREGG